MYFQKKAHIPNQLPFHFSCCHITQHMYRRFPVPPSYGTAARWVVPARAGCSPRSCPFASSGWRPAERAAARAACAPRPGRTACWCPALRTTEQHCQWIIVRWQHFLINCSFALLFATLICATLISSMEFHVALCENMTEISFHHSPFHIPFKVHKKSEQPQHINR